MSHLSKLFTRILTKRPSLPTFTACIVRHRLTLETKWEQLITF